MEGCNQPVLRPNLTATNNPPTEAIPSTFRTTCSSGFGAHHLPKRLQPFLIIFVSLICPKIKHSKLSKRRWDLIRWSDSLPSSEPYVHCLMRGHQIPTKGTWVECWKDGFAPIGEVNARWVPWFRSQALNHKARSTRPVRDVHYKKIRATCWDSQIIFLCIPGDWIVFMRYASVRLAEIPHTFPKSQDPWWQKIVQIHRFTWSANSCVFRRVLTWISGLTSLVDFYYLVLTSSLLFVQYEGAASNLRRSPDHLRPPKRLTCAQNQLCRLDQSTI